jgi:hypothetical protein
MRNIPGTRSSVLWSVVLLGVLAFVSASFAQDKTVINSQTAKQMLLGRHMFSLQWISWDYFGRATVTQKGGVLFLQGEQKARDGNDLLTIDGTITEVNRYDFRFNGKIVTQVSHINNGEPCVREGDFTFKITGKRKYWRLMEMDNPCEGVTDYVDIFFKK